MSFKRRKSPVPDFQELEILAFTVQARLWKDAPRAVPSSSKAAEVWVDLIVLAVVAMSSLALRAHGVRSVRPSAIDLS